MDKIQMTEEQARDVILAQYQYSGSKLEEEEIQARILNLKQADYIKKDKDIVEEAEEMYLNIGKIPQSDYLDVIKKQHKAIQYLKKQLKDLS